MRTAFIETLLELAEQEPRITLVVGDLGFGVVETFADRFPTQFVNAAVAEQNMTGIAAGLALSGRIVFTYSIANFPTTRCLEQIRNDVCYHNANVKVVAVGGGFAYGSLGVTHHATEDLAVMRAMPGMAVLAPGDPVEVRHAVRAAARQPGPCYLRLGRVGEPVVHPDCITFQIGKAIRVREGEDMTLISTGGMLELTLRVASRLSGQGVAARVVSMHTLKPLDVGEVTAAAVETRAIVTIEEHSIIGGLGSAVAEVLAETEDVKVSFKRIGLPSKFQSEIGDQDFLRAASGLSEEGLLNSLRPILDRITQTAACPAGRHAFLHVPTGSRGET